MTHPDTDELIERSLFLASGQDDPHSVTITELCAALRTLKAERDAAWRECSDWARKAGEAQGRLEASELAGVVDGWRERAEKAERELAARTLSEGQ